MSLQAVTDQELIDWAQGGPVPSPESVVLRVSLLQRRENDLAARLQARRPPADDAELAPGVTRFKNLAQLRAEGVRP